MVPPAPPPAPGTHVQQRLRKVFDILGINTILGRFILTALALVLATITMAWLSHTKVSLASRVNTANLSGRVSSNHQLRQLSDELWQTEMNFQNYMLVPNTSDKIQLLNNMRQIHVRITALQHDPQITNHPDTKQMVDQLAVNRTRLNHSMASVLDLRAEPLKVFPYIGLMLNELNPLHMEFISNCNIAIDAGKNSINSQEQYHVVQLFNELRYTWSQRINAFRIFTSNRVGVYFISVEKDLQSGIHDIGIYNDKITALLAELTELEKQDKLGFEQSNSVGELKKIHSSWNKSYERIKSIILSEDGWRADLPIVRDEINPLFVLMWQHLHDILVAVEQRAADDIDNTTKTADQVSNQLWWLSVVVISVALFGTLFFNAQIRQPIRRVVTALKAEASGEKNILLPQSNIAEANDLAVAFTHMREQIHNRQEHLQAILTYAAEAILTINEDDIIESINPAAEKLFGCPGTGLVGKNLNLVIPELHQPHTANPQAGGLRLSNTGILGKLRELNILRADGVELPVTLRISEMFVGGRCLYLALVSDNRERRDMLEKIRAREQHLRSILDNTAEGIISFNSQCEIESWNSAAEFLFGWSPQEALGLRLSEFITPENIPTESAKAQFCNIKQVINYIGRETEVVGQHKNGTLFPVAIRISIMQLEGTIKYNAVIANITERKAMMENLRNLAEHDSLTGLYNRAFFHNVLEKSVDSAKATPGTHSVLLYIDLDNFKYVNDTLGHAAGDKLLIEVSKILNQRTRRSDLVARLGGDEFVVVINNIDTGQIPGLAESFRRLLAEYSFHYNGRTVDISCSIGVAAITETVNSSSEIMSQADLACHLAKRNGRNRVHVYTQSNAEDVQTMSIDIGWSRRIKHALEHNRFVLAAQPVVATRTHETSVFEILVRLLDDDGSIIMPTGFLPTAERFGLSAEIDAWVITHAIKHLALVRAQGADIRYALNLSGQSITATRIAELIPAVLEQTKLDPRALTFEITETAAIADMNMAVGLLTKLQSLGCLTALDDFGSGMSSFAYLRELPVNIVKIDGRFIRNLANSSIDQAMVKAMNEIAHALGKQTVGEFVENESHFRVLCEMGVDYGQGYYLGKPALLDIRAVLESGKHRLSSTG
ncbi:MAG: EAL domain-containing protein [Gammaproteobacteria bacterium]|nr:EAL domain-containing protein [Gammaproteobacteria bacterium]